MRSAHAEREPARLGPALGRQRLADPRRDPVSVRCRQPRTVAIQVGFDPAGNPPRRLMHGIPLQMRIPRSRLHLAMAEQAADHRQAFPERQRPRRERVPAVVKAHVL